jgi:hypothetical protein
VLRDRVPGLAAENIVESRLGAAFIAQSQKLAIHELQVVTRAR